MNGIRLSEVRPIRIAVLLPSLQMGGAERLVIEELGCLKDDGRFAFELHLVFEKGPFFKSFAALSLPVYVWNAPHKSLRMLKTYAGIALHLRRTRCQILHSHLLDGIGPLVGKLAGVRVVSTVHSDTRYGRIEKFVLRLSDHALACGQQVEQTIRSFLSTDKVSKLPNAVAFPANPVHSREDTLARFGVSPGSLLIVSLGRITRSKGFDVLIEAFCRVAAEVPEAVLLIGGNGDDMDRLQKLVEFSGYSDRIRLPGFISNVNDILYVSTLYVNSSSIEGLPMTLLEAMAHGKPMVATRVGGNPEVVRDGVTGLLVPPDDPGSLADAIICLLRDDSFRETAGVAAHDLFLREYTIARHCDTLKMHYLRLVSAATA